MMNAFQQKLFFLFAMVSLQLIQSNPAKAHSIETRLNYINGVLELQTEFSTGDPVKGAFIKLLKPDGFSVKQLGRTNQEGKLELNIPEIKNGQVDLQIDGGPGHRDYLLLPIRSGKVILNKIVLGNIEKSLITWMFKRTPNLLGPSYLLGKINLQK